MNRGGGSASLIHRPGDAIEPGAGGHRVWKVALTPGERTMAPTPMPTLRSQLDQLARSFAEQVISAIRGSSLQELTATNGRVARTDAPRAFASSGAARKAVTEATGTATRTARAARSSGRLPRRSADEIAAELDKIVALVKRHKDGLRAEAIRSNLGMQSKEMPRILKEGIAKKKLSSKGQKRATTYFAK